MEEYQNQTNPVGEHKIFPSESIGEEKPKNKNKLIIGLVVVILLVPIILLAARIWDPVWNPFRPSPERVIERMMMAEKEIETVGFSAEILYGFTDINFQEDMEVLLNIKGSVDLSDPDDVKMFMSFTGTTDFQGLTFSVSGELVSINKNSYFRLTDMPALLRPFGLGGLQDQWIALREDSTTFDPIEEEYRDKIIKAFKERDIYRVEKVFPDKEINGLKAYHYLISLDLAEVILTAFEVMAEEDELFRALDIEEMRESFYGLSRLEAEIWIGKKDYLLYAISLDERIETAEIDPTDEGFLSLKADINFFDFNQPVSITEPEESKSLEEVIEDLFGQFLMGGLSGPSPMPDDFYFDESNDWFDDDWFMERP